MRSVLVYAVEDQSSTAFSYIKVEETPKRLLGFVGKGILCAAWVPHASVPRPNLCYGSLVHLSESLAHPDSCKSGDLLDARVASG